MRVSKTLQGSMWKGTTLCMGGLLLVVAACSTPADAVAVVDGTACESGDRGKLVCGTTKLGKPAQLACEINNLQMVWVVKEACKVACTDGACTDAADSWFTDLGSDVAADTQVQDTAPEFVDAATACEAGETACLNMSTLGTCRQDGSGYDSSPCPELTACDKGSCFAIICQPGENPGTCTGPTSYRVCSATGTDWVDEYCSVPYKCYNGECKDLGCPPDAVVCAGMTGVQKCVLGEDGKYSWKVIETCDGGICKDGACVSYCEVNLKENSYLGCEYFAVDLDNIEGGAVANVAVVVSVPKSSSKAATITFTDMSTNPPKDMTAAELQVPSLDVQPGTLEVFILPTGHDIDGSIQTNKTFRIKSTAPVTVHQFNPLNGENVFTNDASLLLPGNVGAQEYIALAWPQRDDGSQLLRGFVAVVATQEGVTQVDVTASTKILSGTNVNAMQAGETATFFLAQGDVLNLESDGGQGADVTGTLIKADKKVNVIGGHECANVPLGVNYCDHMESQLYPVQVWGNKYIGDAFRPRSETQKDTWRVLAGEDNIAVTLSPNIAGPFNLNKGQWSEFSVEGSFELNATGPVLLGHYMQGSNYPGFKARCDGMTGIGDPAFTLAVPMHQYLSEYIVLTPPGYTENYLSIVFKVGTEVDVKIDDKPLPMFLTPTLPAAPAGPGGWAVAQIIVQEGVHTVSSKEPIAVSAYGYDCDVSYAYPGGLSLKTTAQ